MLIFFIKRPAENRPFSARGDFSFLAKTEWHSEWHFCTQTCILEQIGKHANRKAYKPQSLYLQGFQRFIRQPITTHKNLQKPIEAFSSPSLRTKETL